jgi:hypothetical protein
MTTPEIIISIILLIVFCFLNCLQIIGFYTACYVDTEKRLRNLGYHSSPVLQFNYEVEDENSKMILWRVKLFCLNTFGEFWSKPICTCPACMASLHSFWIWIPIYLSYDFSFILVYIHIFYILVLCGLNKLVTSKFEL